MLGRLGQAVSGFRKTSPPILAGQGILALAAATTVLFSGATAYVALYDAPYWDLWQHVNRDNLLTDLFARNNEHPVVSNRLLFWLDDQLFSATSRFVQAVSLLALASQPVLFVWLARMAGVGRPILAVGAASAVFVFYPFGFENTIWIFQVSMVLAFTAAAASFVCFARHVGSESRTALAASAFLAFVAVVSFANGILAPALLLLMAIWLRRFRAAIVFGVITLAALAWQLSANGGGPGEPLGLGALDEIFLHFLTQLGAPIGWAAGYLHRLGGPSIHATAIASIVGFACAVLSVSALGFIAMRRRRDPAMLAAAAIILFALATSALVAVGRFHFGPDQALSSRYNINAAILYSALVVVCAAAAAEAPATVRRALPWGSVVLAAGLLLMSATSAPMLLDLAGRYRGGLAGVVALVAGVRDEAAVGQLSFDYDTAVRESELFRENRRWMFAAPTSRRMGEVLGTEETAASPCAGSVWSVSPPDPEHGFLKADGQLDRASRTSGASHVLVTDSAGAIVGYGRVPRRASDLNPFVQNDGRPIDWIGRIRSGQSPPLFAWLADDSSIRCALGPPATVPGMAATRDP